MNRPLALFVLVVALALVALSGYAAGSATGSDAKNRGIVAFVGDSNIVRGGGPMVQYLTYGPNMFNPTHSDNSYVPVFIARAGAGLRSPDCPSSAKGCRHDNFWAVKLGAFRRIKADAVVTELGINDAIGKGSSSGPGYAAYDQKIDTFMRLLPTGKPVFWTNLPCTIEPASRRPGCAIVNNALEAAKARWSNLRVINWAGVAAEHPEFMDTAPKQSEYRVHYSAAGYAMWSQIVMNALDRKLPSP